MAGLRSAGNTVTSPNPKAGCAANGAKSILAYTTLTRQWVSVFVYEVAIEVTKSVKRNQQAGDRYPYPPAS